MKQSVVTDALLLRATDYRDADRIVTLFTHQLGRVSAIARAARSSRRRFAGALEPYAIIRVEVELGSGELEQLKRAEVLQSFSGILAHLGRMQAAGVALSLLRELHAPRVPDEALFLSAVQYLTLLDHQDDAEHAALLAFVMRALSLSGMAPRLSACGRSGDPVPEGKAAYFEPALGAVVSRRFGGGPFLFSASTRDKLIRAQGEGWLSIASEAWEQDNLRVARAALSSFVEQHLSRELASRLFPA